MGLGMRMSLRMVQECSVCGKPHGETSQEDTLEVLLTGAKRYAFCCCCFQAVGRAQMGDRGYRRRWREWVKDHKEDADVR